MFKEGIRKNKPENFSGLTIEDSILKLVKVRKGKQIELYNWISIPEGLIANNRVTNKKKLAEYINKLRKEAKPKPDNSPFVILGLPEDQIFIQTIEVPDGLTDEEISKTVEHRSDELFPLSYSDIILDWQVIEKKVSSNSIGSSKKRILIIAAPGKLIKSLVESVQLAGWEPLSVEPKSFSIHRLLNFILKKQSLILIDFEVNSASVSIYRNGKIKFHTKISQPLTREKVVGSISRMLHYYHDKYPQSKPISRVIYSGDVGDKEFLTEIGSEFDRVQIEKITLPKLDYPKGFESKTTFFASTIALALSKIDIFKKHGTINLLPTEIKNNHRVNLAENYLGLITRMATFFAVFIIGLMLIFSYKLSFDRQKLAGAIESKQNYKISQSLKLKEEIAVDLNRKSNLLVSLYSQNNPNLPKLLNNVIARVPRGVEITNINFIDSRITFSGLGSREDILRLRDRLESYQDINNVSLPLSSLASKDQSDFQITFNINN